MTPAEIDQLVRNTDESAYFRGMEQGRKLGPRRPRAVLWALGFGLLIGYLVHAVVWWVN